MKGNYSKGEKTEYLDLNKFSFNKSRKLLESYMGL
ncbi:hypothetical protein METP1_02638 [Methanosarcinales archaeon]|nr:hypothetical protein METP1_02638 [Methanosarcinales archaeon]